MSNKSRLFSKVLTTVPAEDWYRNWPTDRTIMLSMTSKKIRDIINKINILAIVCLKWEFWIDQHNGSTEVKLKFITEQLITKTNLYKITTLVLRRCFIQKNIDQLEEVLKQCPKLKKLDLYNNGINPKGAQKIVNGLKHCNELLHLNLKLNKFGDEGAKKITKLLKLKYCPNLSYLNLSFTLITDKTIEKLAKVIIESGRTALKYIRLSYNHITENGMICLFEMLQIVPNIIYFDLSDNKFYSEPFDLSCIAKKYNINFNSSYNFSSYSVVFCNKIDISLCYEIRQYLEMKNY